MENDVWFGHRLVCVVFATAGIVYGASVMPKEVDMTRYESGIAAWVFACIFLLIRLNLRKGGG